MEPDVREDLPIVDLPKHLQQWLAAQENLDDGDLPAGLGAEELDRLRDTYKQRPRRRAFDLFGASSTGQRVVLLGDPGAGKSSLVRYLALSLADPSSSPERTPFTGYLPVLIELKSYEAARSEQRCATFLEFYALLSRSEGLGLDEEPLHRYLSEDGRAVALFDGLDEIFDPAHRAAVARQIAAFAARYPQVCVVVTSRIIGYSRSTLVDAGFTHATLQDLDTAQISDFLAGWYSLALQDRPADAELRKERLLAAISDSRSIGEMAGNPLLLTILAIIGRHQELPRERWKVYDYAATVLVERWDVNRHLRDEHLPIGFIGEDDKKELLRRVALRMQAGTGSGGSYLTGEELRREFEDYLQARFRKDPADAAMIAQAMIGQFHERNFILSRYGGELYGFVHRAFLEYFCAEAFRWQFERDQVITLDELKSDVFGRHWDDPAWHEVLRLLAGTIREQWMAQIVSFLVDEVNLPWPWRFKDKPPWNVALAAQCLTEGRTVTGLDHAAARVLVRVIQLLEHGILDEDEQSSALLRTEIFPAIASVGSSWPGREIYLHWYLARGVRLAWDPISELAAQIAAGLFPQEPMLMEAILISIRATSDTRLRQPLLEVVANYAPRGPQVRALLLDRAGADSDPDVRGAAVQALAGVTVDDPQTRALLLDRAASDSDPDVRNTAVQALADTAAADPQVRAVLLDRAANDTAPNVRRAAVQALADAAAADPQARALLLERAGSDYPDLRRAAVQALAGAAADDPQVRGLVLDRAASDINPDVRSASVRALAGAAADDPQARALLLDCAASDTDHDVRDAAVRALGGTVTDDPQVRAMLLDRAANDTDPGVRSTSVQALAGAAADDPQARALLLDRAASDTDRIVRYATVLALAGAAADDRQVRALLLDRAASDTDLSVRRVAVQALIGAPTDDPQVRALLLDRAANDTDPSMRRLAVQVLSAVAANDPQVGALLLDRAADDTDPSVRSAVTRALAGAMADDPQVRALLLDRAANDTNPDVRSTAMQALAGAMADDPQVRALLLDRAANDTNPDVRSTAMQALARAMADDPQVRALLLDRAANDTNPNMRGTAMQALARAMADDPQARSLLLDRAANDTDQNVRSTAVRALAGAMAGDPQVRTLLMDRARMDETLDVSASDWVRNLFGGLKEPASEFIASGAVNESDHDWICQLAVRIDSCSEQFDPGKVPSIENKQGIFREYIVGV